MLRTRITEGRLSPGTRLSEEDIGAALGVSRNTLREARLGHERLLLHEFNRGVFVRKLNADEAAAAGDQWVEVGTANMHFHQAVAALARALASPRRWDAGQPTATQPAPVGLPDD